jgi:hypothetical protein
MPKVTQNLGFAKVTACAIATFSLNAFIPPSEAANLTTYDFDFNVPGNTITGSFSIDIDNPDRTRNPPAFDYTAAAWDSPVTFSGFYNGNAFGLSDLSFFSFGAFKFTPTSLSYPRFGSYYYGLNLTSSKIVSTSYGYPGNLVIYQSEKASDGDLFFPFAGFSTFGTNFTATITERTPPPKPVPFPGLALGVLVAGGLLTAKQIKQRSQKADC